MAASSCYHLLQRKAAMGKPSTRKIGLEMDARLYAELSKLAKENGQSRRFLLEKALEHYLEFVVPMQGTVRPEVRSHFRRSTDKNRKLHELLAK
jgi:hypothetical protein